MTDFVRFPKIPRLFRDMVITEKIDGTNACVVIDDIEPLDLTEYEQEFGIPLLYTYDANDRKVAIRAASRTRYITAEKDNFGFAKWVFDNAHKLAKLGPGRHFGEWWGKGIQRGYGLDCKRFSLFNVAKWHNPLVRPDCCGCVPVLYEGPFNLDRVSLELAYLRDEGSIAAKGYMKPEGVVVFHTAGNVLFKATLVNDEKGKTE